MISDQVPKHLVVGARTGFLNSINTARPRASYARLAMEADLTEKDTTLVDLGDAPMPQEGMEGLLSGDFIEKTMQITPKEFNLPVHISYNAVKDDKTGDLERKVMNAGQRYTQHLNKLVFQTLNGGDGSTYGVGYDGQEFFCATHVDKGAKYSTAQDNEYGLGLTPSNFETVWVAAQQFVDDQGEYTEYMYDTLVCHPNNRVMATQVAKNPNIGESTDRNINPFNGEIEVVTTPYFDTTAWVLASGMGATKPLIIGMREMPHLQHAWFDPTKPEGGWFWFKFYARYVVVYGDWRRAIMGNT